MTWENARDITLRGVKQGAKPIAAEISILISHTHIPAQISHLVNISGWWYYTSTLFSSVYFYMHAKFLTLYNNNILSEKTDNTLGYELDSSPSPTSY